jgi:tRNA(fMet)-specific endonuclease VapC
MKYLLDTNICIYLIRNRPPSVRQKLMAYGIDDIGISIITVAELQVGVERNQHREQAESALEHFLRSITIALFDVQAAIMYGKLQTQLERKGLPIGPLDFLIAAHALSLDSVLVTNNERAFRRVPGLQVENWVASQ